MQRVRRQSLRFVLLVPCPGALGPGDAKRPVFPVQGKPFAGSQALETVRSIDANLHEVPLPARLQRADIGHVDTVELDNILCHRSSPATSR